MDNEAGAHVLYTMYRVYTSVVDGVHLQQSLAEPSQAKAKPGRVGPSQERSPRALRAPRARLYKARSIQGLHMPMKLGIKRFITQQINLLPSMATRNSNLMEDILTGRDESIDIEDVFNSPMEFPEQAGDPHALMERRLGIL
ncbi:proteasome maturation protein-like [Watersipora subatra]|uniref:proteasome maturation protein-like n=1 Tax=Watersipora subatra TaxID=2589382 RepID=UPI00355B1837